MIHNPNEFMERLRAAETQTRDMLAGLDRAMEADRHFREIVLRPVTVKMAEMKPVSYEHFARRFTPLGVKK